MLGSTPIFWRSGRQGFVTLSAAEAELTQIVEGMVAGESIYVILAELYPTISKVLKTDGMSALAILTKNGGNWRTRHLRQHVSGERMLTKPLTSTPIEFLKNLVGMGKLPPL